MCRFVAYLGKKPVVLSRIIDTPKNSLINQSRQARDGALGLNADGFGIGWYAPSIDNEPGLFKSIQPAWNDENLKSIASKVQSTCFIGHVRASTVGDVNISNCHPFTYKQFLFVHNGTIRGMHVIRRDLLNSMSDDLFKLIKGQTDSELFFSLLMDVLEQTDGTICENALAHALHSCIDTINVANRKSSNKHVSRLNTVLTNGKSMVATRYISDKKEAPLSLYFAVGEHVTPEKGGGRYERKRNGDRRRACRL